MLPDLSGNPGGGTVDEDLVLVDHVHDGGDLTLQQGLLVNS